MDVPLLKIIEQPRSRGYRFRYECEGSSHGNITGANSSKGHRTFPTVQLVNWQGYARISVQCVTNEEKPKPHTHELIGKNCKDGICVIELKPSDNNIAKFDGLSIKHSTRKRAIEILTLRNQEAILQEKRQQSLSQYGQYLGNDLKLTEEEKQRASEEAKKTSPELDPSVVRLLFKANLLTSPNGPVIKTMEVVSEPIYDAKSPGAAALRICRMDKSSGSCVGDEEIFLLCDKVQKDDIAVCFEKYDKKGLVEWEAFGKFGPQDVHRQFAIVFRTPQYKTTQIDTPVEVKVKLKRLSKPEESNAVSFTYHPEDQDEERIKHKRKKKLNYNLLTTQGSNDVHNVSSPASNGMVAGNGNMLRNNMQPTCTHPAVSGQVQGTIHNQPVSLTGSNTNGSVFPMNTVLPSMTYSNLTPMKHSPQAPSPASSFTSSPENLPSPQLTCDRSIDYCQPFDHVITMYEQTSYQGRGLPEKTFVPSLKPTPSTLQHKLLSEPVHVLDLSNPQPLSLTTCKLKSDCDSRCETSSNFTRNNSLIPNSVKKNAESTQNFDVLHKKPTESTKDVFGSQLARQIISFGDRLFEALMKYAETADISTLLMVLRHLLTKEDENGDNVLHLAVINKKLDPLRKFLKVMSTLKDCDIINRTNDQHQTPLHLATVLRDAVVVELLLSHNASVTIVDCCGNTPLHVAVIHKAPECLKLILGSLPNKNKGKSPEVDRLNYKGLAPLHLAVQVGHLDCVKALVESGRANINIEDGCSGKTPLHYSVEKNHLLIVGYLISQAQIDINAPDFSGFTPLHMAVLLRLQGCAALLMAAGADPDVEIIENVADSEDESSSDIDQEEPMSEKERQHPKEDKKKLCKVNGNNEEAEELPVGTVVTTAWTLAQGDDVMESILRCEENPEPGNTLESVKFNELIHRGSMKEDNHLYTLPAGETDLDMTDLDAVIRMQLAQLLDPLQPKENWKALAEKLGMSSSIIEVFGYMDSPTKALLDNYESTEGSIKKLQDALIEMKREDAAKLIDEVKRMKEVARTVHGGTSFMSVPLDLAKVESGFESMMM